MQIVMRCGIIRGLVVSREVIGNRLNSDFAFFVFERT